MTQETTAYSTWLQDSVFTLLLRESRAEGIALLLLSVLVGILHGVAIVLVAQNALKLQVNAVGNLPGFLLFGAVLILFIGAKYLALEYGVQLTERATTQLMIRLAEFIRHTELRGLEILGRERIHANLTRDIKVFANSAMLAVHNLQSITVILVILAYLWVNSTAIFLLVVVIGGFGFFLLARADQNMRIQARQANTAEDHFFDLFSQTLDGFKELKLDRKKLDNLFNDYMIPAAQDAMSFRISAGREHVYKVSLFNWLYFPALAVIAFDPDISSTIGSLIVLMFIWTPMIDILAAIPNLVNTQLSVQRIRIIEQALQRGSIPLPRQQECPMEFKEIHLENIVYEYTDNHGKMIFRIGPLNFRIRSGTITMVVGGNGSGKSTLLKLLTGLYPPLAGKILLDGESLLIDDYRGLFSGVFVDFHLFSRLYGIASIDPQEVERLLNELRLTEKTRIENRAFTETALSTGQRKRLALIAAYLEQRPIYVFDEWTADQDPEFRRYFHEILLQDLKRQGKTVICVTHDDRYFHYADQLITLKDGLISGINHRDEIK